jgi:hypothetical protein
MTKVGAKLQEKNSYSLSQMNQSAPVGNGGSRRKEVVPDGPVSFLNPAQIFPDKLNSQTIKAANEEYFKTHSSLPSSAVLTKSLHELTHDDLEKLAYGVPNEHGDLVYFRLTFLEDPWAGI